MKKTRNALAVTRAENFPDWYQAVIVAADLAEPSGVRGCMIIKPWGYRIWERIQHVLDADIQATGHENCYFPIFIPLDLIQKEATHVEGFAKEVAVVTHYRLEEKDGNLVPAAPLESPLVVRPTSEAMMMTAFKRWIHSYRDLPVLVNQWSNVVRWEMRPRLFLRTSEFLWQEGHTAHATAEEAMVETRTMLGVYQKLAEETMAIPVVSGIKSPAERFPGAEETHTIEAMMQDGRALQAGTSHYLGQNFSTAEDIVFTDRNGELCHVYTTSWGASTRLIGATIMVHGDDDGLRLPPHLSPYQIVIIPILREEILKDEIVKACQSLAQQLRQQSLAGEFLRAFVDLRDDNAANKRWSWLKKGVPLVCEIGPRDLRSAEVAVHNRLDISARARMHSVSDFVGSAMGLLLEIQETMIGEAKRYRENLTVDNVKTFEAFKAFFSDDDGFVRAKWSGDQDSEEILKELGVTIRCLPYEQSETSGACVLTGAEATLDAIFAKAY